MLGLVSDSFVPEESVLLQPMELFIEGTFSPKGGFVVVKGTILELVLTPFCTHCITVVAG